AERVAALGGLHRFMDWPRPILTDSGGFQVMSLAKLRKLTEQGVTFRSHIDGSAHELTPERSIDIQLKLDSDIIMQLDECIALPAPPAEIARAMELSLRWAERSKAAFGSQSGRALFGIVQGGDDAALRAKSAAGLTAIGFDGYAVGATALPHGRRQAGRHPGRHRAGHRHVRLRPPDSCRTAWSCLHAHGRDQPEECPAPGRSAPARRDVSQPQLPAVLAGLSA